jgi:4-amino-4-deoxy-L-arabinose transferase-like glycosyltransferase
MIGKGIINLWRQHKLLLTAIIIILLLRIFFIGAMGLMPQDAYYYFYSQHPALSYYDHPPAIAWVLRFFTNVFGENVYAIKLADSVITFLAIITFYQFAKCFLSKHRVQSAVILFLSTLMVTILSLVSTPDTPLILCWTLSLLTLHHAIFRGQKIYWVLAGICMGLAFDSKYTAIFLPAGVVLFLLLSNDYRRLLISPWPWIAFLLFAVTITPVVAWNVENHFASFAFQSASRMDSIEQHHFSITNFLGVLGHQSAILMPILFFALLLLLYKVIKRFVVIRLRIPVEQLFLFCFFAPLFVGFLCISFIYWVKLNWMMPAYISGIVWLSMYIKEKWIRYQVGFSLAVHVLLAFEVLFYPVPIKSDDTWVGWKSLAEQVKGLQQRYPNTFVFSADDYKTSAVLNFYLDEMVYAKNVIGQQALQFDYIGTNLQTLKGKNALFIDSSPRDLTTANTKADVPNTLPAYFDAVTELSPIIVKQNDRVTRKFHVYLCTRYRSKPVISGSVISRSVDQLSSRAVRSDR